MSRNARLTPEERYQRRIQGLMRGSSATKPSAEPRQSIDSDQRRAAEARALAEMRAEAKANAIVIAQAQAAITKAKPWIPASNPTGTESTAWFD